jgi:hypothetical protein
MGNTCAGMRCGLVDAADEEEAAVGEGLGGEGDRAGGEEVGPDLPVGVLGGGFGDAEDAGDAGPAFFGEGEELFGGDEDGVIHLGAEGDVEGGGGGDGDVAVEVAGVGVVASATALDDEGALHGGGEEFEEDFEVVEDGHGGDGGGGAPAGGGVDVDGGGFDGGFDGGGGGGFGFVLGAAGAEGQEQEEEEEAGAHRGYLSGTRVRSKS